MFILKGIGSLFVKLWRWIKETAWVQPLLIVGGIFALIFSIPSIKSWAESWGGNGESVYYQSKKLTLELEGDDDNNSSSVADVFTRSVHKNTVAAYEGRYDDIDLGTQEEEKYFLLFVGSDCQPCINAEEGFKELDEKWGSTYIPSDGKNLAIHTIFSDEESSTDSKYSAKGETAFQRYLLIHSMFFNDTSAWLIENTPYKANNGVSDDSYGNFGAPNTDDFTVPSVLLVDYSQEAKDQGRAGVSEIIFSVSGDTKQSKADFLLQMWNHTDTGAAGIKNPFCLNYMK